MEDFFMEHIIQMAISVEDERIVEKIEKKQKGK